VTHGAGCHIAISSHRDVGVAAWRRGGVAASRRGDVATWRRGDVDQRRSLGPWPSTTAHPDPPGLRVRTAKSVAGGLRGIRAVILFCAWPLRSERSCSRKTRVDAMTIDKPVARHGSGPEPVARVHEITRHGIE